MDVLKMISNAFSDHFLFFFNIFPYTHELKHEKMSIQTKNDIPRKHCKWKE